MTAQPTVSLPVVLIEEQQLFRMGLRAAFGSTEIQIVAEFSSTAAALAGMQALEMEEDAIVLCSLGQRGWQELASRLLLQSPGRKILGIVDQATDEVATEALRHGLLACLDRALPLERWVSNLRDARANRISPGQTLLRRPAVARYALVSLSQPPVRAGLDPLTPTLGHQERLVLANLSEEVPPNLVAERLGLSEEGLKVALDSVFRKVLARSRMTVVHDELQSS